MKTVRSGLGLMIFLWVGGQLSAQSTMKGHWSGSIDTPNGPIGVEFDLDQTANGWIGSVSIPAQNASGLPLDLISFSDGKGTFRIKGAPGDPTFTGKLSADGKALDGQIVQSGVSLPLKLNRTGEAKVETPKSSPPVAAEFVGTWEGTIQAGPGLRIVIKIANGKAGAEGSLTSVDQGNAEVPLSAVTQNGKKLSLQVNGVNGGYEGEINAAGTQLTGTWSQLGNSIPLDLKKAAAPAKP